MDKSKLREIVEAHAPALIRRLGIPHWTIVFYYDLRDSKGDFSKKAEATRQVDYLRATVNFDPEEIDDEEEALRILRHELIHVVLAPFDVLWNAARAFWEGDKVQSAVMDSIWDHVVEQAVINIERVSDGHAELLPESAAKATKAPRGKPPEARAR